MKTLDRHFGVFLEVASCDDRHMARLALAALGAALGLFAIVLAIWEPGALTLPAPVHVAIGWSFVAAGLVAWQQRPENRLGLLMTLTGIVWFGRDFDWFAPRPPTTQASSRRTSFWRWSPTRSSSSRRRHALAARALLVAAAYALAVLAYPPSEVSDTRTRSSPRSGSCSRSLIVYVVVDRWLEAEPAERRALRPLLVFGPPVLVVAAVTIAHDYIGVSLSDDRRRGRCAGARSSTRRSRSRSSSACCGRAPPRSPRPAARRTERGPRSRTRPSSRRPMPRDGRSATSSRLRTSSS